MATSKTAPKPPHDDSEFEFAPGWRPNVGESLTGTVVARDKGENEYGPYVILTLRPDKGRTIHVQDPDGEARAIQTEETDAVAVHCFGTVLGNSVKKVRPKVGERIAFKKGEKYLRKGVDESRAKTSDWINAWQVRLLTDRGDDDLYGVAESRSRERDGDPGGEFSDEPPF